MVDLSSVVLTVFHITSNERIEADLIGTAMQLTLTVERVRSTFSLDAPEHLRDGRTVIGHCGDLSFAVRIPQSDSETVAHLKPGDTFSTQGVMSGWERLYRQAIIDVQ